ncbi:hypothetical protein [Paludisphaera sp.]|uniref:hypothetical protein n=1 Tax=Paludisphaera sp. TaxID=2017432 RepID=UPI00301D5CBD
MLRRGPEVAPAEPAAAPAVEEDEWNWRGTYELGPAGPPRPMPGAADRATVGGPLGPWPDEPGVPDEPAPPAETAEATDDGEWAWRGTYELGADPPAPASAAALVPEEPRGAVEDAGSRPPLAPRGRDARREPEDAEPEPLDPWFPPRLLYPSRGVEGLAMVAAIGGAAWVMGTLAPEYCLAILADGELLGTPSMGRLIALVSALPVLILSPLVIVYDFQYLARVLAASSDGEPLPPRPPDRNADGLLDGVGSWLLWIVLGAGVGLLPLAAYRAALAWTGGSWSPVVAAALGLVGLPYALMALMMTFLHDDDLAARPGAILGAIARLGPSFLGLSLTVAALLAPVGIAFAAALALRDRAFWAYIPASLACWLLAAWLPIVAMHTVGSYHAPRKRRLKWRRKRPRWGAN